MKRLLLLMAVILMFGGCVAYPGYYDDGYYGGYYGAYYGGYYGPYYYPYYSPYPYGYVEPDFFIGVDGFRGGHGFHDGGFRGRGRR